MKIILFQQSMKGYTTIRNLSLLFVLLAAGSLLLTSGCATVPLNRSRNEFYGGKPDEAENRMGSARISGKNKVLLLMERGLICQTNKNYKKSNRDFLDAAKEIDEFETIRIGAQTASFLSSDLVLGYAGEPFERVLIHTYSAINFLMLGKWEDALVECKRALKKLDRSPFPDRQPFTNYLAAICYEMMGDYDDARIEYEKAIKAAPGVDLLKQDLDRVSGGARTPGKSELICFIQIGKSPVKRATEFFSPPDKRFVLPEYHRRRYLCRKAAIQVSLSNQTEASQSQPSYFLTNIETLAGKTLEARMEKEIAREIARLAAKEIVSREVEEKASQIIATLIRIGFMLSESADVRSWQTLPAKLGVARLFLEPGTYDIKVSFLDARDTLVQEVSFKKVRVKKERKAFLLSRSSR